jgi:uncharacterized membrane protein YphA (DoxX/SURF4 family)
MGLAIGRKTRNEPLMTPQRRDALALLILRVALAWFLFVWAINKFLAPVQYQRLWGYFYGIDISANMPFVLGGLQILVCLAMVLGVARLVTYAVAFLMHAVTVTVISSSLMAPFVVKNGFPTNRNVSVALAALGGFAALWLLRHRDHWSLDAWLAGRNGASVE